MSWGFGAARLIVLAVGADDGRGRTGPPRRSAVPAGSITALWLFGIGIAFMVGTLIERVRYRSEAADRSGEPHGPGGGEPPGATIEPRFRRSDEVFVDPTSSRTMRVWIDPGSGERRYVAED